MKSAELDTIYLDLSAGINAAQVTCYDHRAGTSDLLKTQHALDAIAGMLARVCTAAPDEDYETMFVELRNETTALRLVVLQRLNAIDRAA